MIVDVFVSMLIILIFLAVTYGLYASLLKIGKSFFPKTTSRIIKLLDNMFYPWRSNKPPASLLPHLFTPQKPQKCIETPDILDYN